ncbi:MAG: hypothetical protein GX264_03370 [Clostridiales bacterium]|jgi:hypothetical protein|nr:hypothetical protein [Clostridiales bacterium]
MKKFLFYLIQFTWGLPQNLAGLIGYLILSRKNEHERFNYAVVTYVAKENFGGVSLGIFIFMNSRPNMDWRHDTRIHEYGHTIQSLLLGPLYFFVVGIPSAVWCSLPPLVKYRKKNDVSYYTLYCEGWANLWGRRWAKDNFITKEMKGRGHFGKPLAALKF